MIAAIKKSFPYFFLWRELLGQRPNVNPIGLGNSSSEIDFDILGDAEDFADEGSELLEDDEKSSRGLKRKASSEIDLTKDDETDRKPMTSSTPKLMTKRGKMFDTFASISIEEEKTKQSQLQYAATQAKIEGQIKLQLIKSKQEIVSLREHRKTLAAQAELKRAELDIRKFEMGIGACYIC